MRAFLLQFLKGLPLDIGLELVTLPGVNPAQEIVRFGIGWVIVGSLEKLLTGLFVFLLLLEQ